jgi:myosin heavy subunit
MNLVGKIFIVLIFVMSAVFMAFSVAVYASHTNWRNVVKAPDTGLEAQLNGQKLKNEQLQSQLTKMEEQLAFEQKTKREALAKQATEEEAFKRERDQQEAALAKLNQDLREAVATMAATQETLKALRGDVNGLKAEIQQAQEDRDTAFGEMVRVTDELHDAANELKTLQDRSNRLAADYADAVAVLRKHDLKPVPELYTGEAPDVEGEVLAVTANGAIEVNIGSDDGLLQGHKLQIYRIADTVSMYLGKVEVTQTASDKAVCKILPEFRKGTIQRGDRVDSKL